MHGEFFDLGRFSKMQAEQTVGQLHPVRQLPSPKSSIKKAISNSRTKTDESSGEAL